ncbi:MAG: hypothetical protein HKN71_07900 [Gemmatimonadetes bacterium]|nr:hypothetical protein [Gemmatimonadota bacterium]
MRRSTLLPLLLVAFLSACSSSDDPTGPGQQGGTFTATVDGAAWNGQLTGAVNNGFTFALEGTANGVEISLSVNLSQNVVPGTVDLTTGSTGAQVVEGGEIWYAVGQGGSGTLTIQTLTTTGATGTFEFVAGPVANSASGGTRSVTNGQFDVTF